MRIASLLSIFFCASTLAGEVPHGSWTGGYQKISEVQSVWSFTKFKISEATSCGGGVDQVWTLQNSHTNEALKDALEYKKSMLLSAFIAQKEVKLRCENGFITDFIIKN